MVGERLKREREKQGLELQAIADETSIRLTYLEAIENGDYTHLPSDVYVKGFIKNYARALNIEPAPLIFEFEEERGIRREAKEELPPVEPVAKPSDKPFTSGKDYEERTKEPNRVLNFFVGLGVLVLVFLGGVYYIFADEETAPKIPGTEPVTTTNQPATPQGGGQAATTTQAGGQPVAGQAAGQPAGQVAGQPVANGVDIALILAGRSWVHVEVDGATVLEGVIDTNNPEYHWQAKDKVTVTAGGGGGDCPERSEYR